MLQSVAVRELSSQRVQIYLNNFDNFNGHVIANITQFSWENVRVAACRGVLQSVAVRELSSQRVPIHLANLAGYLYSTTSAELAWQRRVASLNA